MSSCIPVVSTSLIGNMSPLVAATLVLGFFVAVQSASLPVVTDCEEDGLWKSGSSYHYAYTAVVTGKAVGTTDRKSGVQITCNVDLAVLGQCRYILKTLDCALSEIGAPGSQANYKKHPRSNKFKEQMKNPVSFLMTKGEVKAIISSDNEQVSALNLKRGIISALLVKRTQTHEDEDELRTDVHGTCPVVYTVSGDHIEYVKDMNKCHYPSRTDFHLSPYSLSWNLSFVQFWMMNATVHCSYDLTPDAVSKIHCYERHAIRFEARHNTAAAVQTVVTQTLELKNTKGDKSSFDRNMKNKQVKEIQYEWEPFPEPTQVPPNFVNQANKLLNDMVDTSKSEMRVFTIPMFDQLVSLLRSSSDVTQFTKSAFAVSKSDVEKELTHSYVRDALVTCNTVPCMKALRWVVENDHMSENYFKVMLYAFTKLKISQPEYIEAILGMCKAKTNRLCLLSLTSIIHSYAVRQSTHDHHHHHQQPQAVKETVQYLTSMLGNDCNPNSVLPELDYYQRVERIILALKSLGNMGDCAQHASNSVTGILGKCINNKAVSHNISLEAIRAFRRMEINSQAYSTLLNVLKNQQLSIEHRVFAYLVLIKNYHQKDLLDELVTILKAEKTQQLGNFVTMHLNNILIYGESMEQLQDNIRTVMSENEDVFKIQGTHPLTSSRHRQFARFYNSPFFHDAISRFGIDVSSSALYETFSYLPQHFIFNLTTQLFSRKFNLLTLSGGLHGVEPVLETLFGNMGLLQKPGDLKKLLKTVEEKGFPYLVNRLQDPVGSVDKSWTHHFNKKIETRLDDIHNSVFNAYGSIKPFGTLSVKLYGDELAFTSLDLIRNRVMQMMSKVLEEIDWEEPIVYRAHRIIRFLEGSNQIPTSVGLPLYWESEATLAISFRAKVKAPVMHLVHSLPFHAEWNVNPSGALTILNTMRVEVPHFTQFGFQANNTAYRSRERAGSLSYDDGDFHLNIKVSDEPQQIINLFRTNKIIRGNELEDIPDYELTRAQSEFCHPDEYSGLKLCRSKSYADVFGKEGKPSILLSGNAEYRVWYEKEDKGLKEYKLHMNVDKSQAPWKKTIIEFEAPGTKWQRKVKGSVKRNLETKEFDVELSVPERPHFRFSASRKMTKEGESTKYVTHLDAEIIKGRPITFHGERFTTTETRPSKIDRKMIVTNIKQTSLKLALKHRTYTWERKFQGSDLQRTYDHTFGYESDSDDSYMHDILPDVFWQTDKKASLKFHLDIQKHSLPNDGWERLISSYVELPKSILELATHHLEQEGERHIIHFNLTKKSLPSRELQSFILFNYDMNNDVVGDHTKRTHVAQFAIPRVRWSLNINREIDPIDNKNTAILTREKARDNSLLITDSSDVSAFHVSLKINHHNASRARGDVYPAPRERDLEIEFTYPRDGEYNTLSYKGKIINDEGQKNAIRSFHTDSHIESTRFKLKVHSKTNYLRTHGKISAHHTSDITYVPSGKTANYKLDLDADFQNMQLTFTQNFVSSFYTFDENLNIVRDNDKINGKLTIKANSPVWDALNVELEQTVQIHPEDSKEEMHFKHKYLDIDVNAEFKLPLGRYYKKEFHIKSKNSIIPTMNWYLFHHDSKYFSAHIEYPEDKRNIYGVLEVDPNYKGGKLTVTHDSPGHGNTTVLDYMLRIVRPNMVLINATIDRQALKKALHIYAERFAKLKEVWNQIKDDPDHPMNQLLKPLVKTSLGDYLRDLKERIQKRRMAIRMAIIDAIHSLEPIYAPTVKVVKGIVLSLERLVLHIINREKTQSVIVWAWHHFEIPQKLEGAAKRFAERARARLSTWSSTTSGGATVIQHPFKWNYITEIPRPSPYLVRRLQRLRKTRSILLGEARPEFKRTAALYSGKNIYTFDGQSYEFPGFAHKDCVYLLAHDFVFRRYSLLLQEGTIHALFPEIAISVNKQGNVGINGTKLNQKPPVSSYNDHVHLETHGDEIKLTSDYGLNGIFNLKQGVVLISLDFWNHNRTLGLLGNNDNEIKNDFKLLNGKITNNEFEFIAEYDVSGRAECKNRKKLQSLRKSCSSQSADECHTLFNEENVASPLYPCFDIVPPKSFHDNCMKDTHCDRPKCGSIAAYVNVCVANDVHIQLPTSCQ